MISVIIPTYNRAPFLREAIQSVLDQDYLTREKGHHEIEVIVVDDGSEDSTEKIVHSFRGKVRYYFQPHRGVSAARNKGLDLGRGKYIAFLDDDDLWRREKLTAQINFMEHHPRAKACYTEEIWLRRGVRVNPMEKHRKYSGSIFDKVLPLCLISLSSAMFRKEVFSEIGNFDEHLPVCEDYDFGIRLAQKYPVYLLDKPLIIKRGGRADQLSRRYWGMDRFRLRALKKALSLDLTQEQEKLVREEIVRKCRILVSGFEKRGRLKEAAEYREFMEKYRLQAEEIYED